MRIILLIYLTILISCSNSQTEKQSTNQEPIDSVITEQPVKSDIQEITTVDSLKMGSDSSKWHFHFNFKNANQKSIDFFSGYEEYDEDKYGLQNPAYLKTFIEGELVFEETFEAYENHWMDFVGTHGFTDTFEFFKLNYGLEAHDYVVAERLIAISNNNVQTVGEFDFQATGYASRYPEYVYPTDSGGISNTIIIIDRVDYRTSEEPNLADTTYYDYVNAVFKKRGS